MVLNKFELVEQDERVVLVPVRDAPLQPRLNRELLGYRVQVLRVRDSVSTVAHGQRVQVQLSCLPRCRGN